MQRSLVLLALGSLVVTAWAWAGEPDKKEAKDDVRELDVKARKVGPPRGDVKKPAVITNADELAKAVADKDMQERIKKDVDFGKQQLLLFTWSGSGQDKLTTKVEAGKKGPEV